MKRLFSLSLVTVLLSLGALAQAQEADKTVLGKLGQAVEKTKLYASPSTGSRVYYTVKQWDYLVINEYEKSDEWLTVLLVNGKYGYIQSELVSKLPYNVTKPAKGGSASRGNIKAALDYSYEHVGTPYKWGGNDIKKGIDCSAFVKDVFSKIGVDLPRTAAEQYKVGTPVTKIEDLKPGDRLYFWDKKRNLIGHTGIFSGWAPDGGAIFIHSSSSNKGVATDDLRDPKWLKILVAARR